MKPVDFVLLENQWLLEINCNVAPDRVRRCCVQLLPIKARVHGSASPHFWTLSSDPPFSTASGNLRGQHTFHLYAAEQRVAWHAMPMYDVH